MGDLRPIQERLLEVPTLKLVHNCICLRPDRESSDLVEPECSKLAKDCTWCVFSMHGSQVRTQTRGREASIPACSTFTSLLSRVMHESSPDNRMNRLVPSSPNSNNASPGRMLTSCVLNSTAASCIAEWPSKSLCVLQISAIRFCRRTPDRSMLAEV